MRLVRGDRRWWYEGVIHEYIATDGDFTQETLAAWAIEHHIDGSSRLGKLTRDAGLLKRALAEDPRNPRSVFYLAQTYRDLEGTAKRWRDGRAALWTMPDIGVARAWRETERPNTAWATRYGDAFDLAMVFGFGNQQPGDQGADDRRQSGPFGSQGGHLTA